MICKPAFFWRAFMFDVAADAQGRLRSGAFLFAR